jgi:hypothetical protein
MRRADGAGADLAQQRIELVLPGHRRDSVMGVAGGQRLSGS